MKNLELTQIKFNPINLTFTACFHCPNGNNIYITVTQEEAVDFIRNLELTNIGKNIDPADITVYWVA